MCYSLTLSKLKLINQKLNTSPAMTIKGAKNQMNTITNQFNGITKMKLFEIAVLDKRTNEIEHIVFDIEINGPKLKATHEALTKAQSESNKIAFVSVDIDEDFSLDSHLQDLYTECTEAIMNSEWFELVN